MDVLKVFHELTNCTVSSVVLVEADDCKFLVRTMLNFFSGMRKHCKFKYKAKRLVH